MVEQGRRQKSPDFLMAKRISFVIKYYTKERAAPTLCGTLRSRRPSLKTRYNVAPPKGTGDPVELGDSYRGPILTDNLHTCLDIFLDPCRQLGTQILVPGATLCNAEVRPGIRTHIISTAGSARIPLR